MLLKPLLSIVLVFFQLIFGSPKEGQLQKLNEHLPKTSYRDLAQNSFKNGEKITYNTSYGILGTIATATVQVESGFFTVNDRTCYKIRVKGKTKGTFTEKLGFRVDNTWISYIDTKSVNSQRYFRYVAENKYRREEYMYFDPKSNQVRMKYEQFSVEDKNMMPKEVAASPDLAITDAKKQNLKSDDSYFTLEQRFQAADGMYYLQDFVSGYYYMRTFDFDKLKDGDIIEVPGVIEDFQYKFEVVYKGKEKIKFKGKNVEAHKFAPVMDDFDNDLFRGKDSITFWASTDGNQVPLIVEAKIFLGSITLELDSYSNLVHTPNF